jgi:hypothetical protein
VVGFGAIGLEILRQIQVLADHALDYVLVQPSAPVVHIVAFADQFHGRAGAPYPPGEVLHPPERLRGHLARPLRRGVRTYKR